MMFIQIKNLTKNYNKYLAVNKINFNIEENTTLGLLGPNGCGKTTTIGMILGLVTPTSGEIMFQNENISKLSRDKILDKFILSSSRSFDKRHLIDNWKISKKSLL